jgi:hypothetical protein
MLDLKVGDLIYRRNKTTQRTIVRKILAIVDDSIHYECVHGYKKGMDQFSACKIKNLRRSWKFVPEEIKNNLFLLDKDIVHSGMLNNFEVLGPDDKFCFFCEHRKGYYYLRKGYAKLVAPYVIKFLTWETINRLKSSYGEDFNLSPTFLIRNKHFCVICGNEHSLTRHHIIPKRKKKHVPKEISLFLNNIMIVCVNCHNVYETHLKKNKDEPQDFTDPVKYCLQWADHFVNVMKPKFLPKDWHIFDMKKFKGNHDGLGFSLYRETETS